MKGLTCGLIFILLFTVFTGCLDYDGIQVRKIDYIPENYYNVTTDQLDDYPPIKYALNEIKNSGEDHSSISCNEKQMDDIRDLFGGEYGEKFFKCNEEFYSLHFVS